MVEDEAGGTTGSMSGEGVRFLLEPVEETEITDVAGLTRAR